MDGQIDVKSDERSDKSTKLENAWSHNKMDETEFHFKTNARLCKLTLWQIQVRQLSKSLKTNLLAQVQHSFRDANRQSWASWGCMHPSKTIIHTVKVHAEEHLNLSTESTHITWALYQRCRETHTLPLIPPTQTGFPQPTVILSLFLRKLLDPRGFSFLLPSPLFPVFFQQQPLFHSWELWPFKEKGSVCLFGLLSTVCLCVCVCVCVWVNVCCWSSDHPSTKTWRKYEVCYFFCRVCFVSGAGAVGDCSVCVIACKRMFVWDW